MKKLLMVLAVVLCFALFAFAQEKPAQGVGGLTPGAAAHQPGATPQAGYGNQTTFEGCLSGPNSAGVYQLKTTTQTLKVGGDPALKEHIGHEVKVTGRWMRPPASAAGTSGMTSTSHQNNELHVSKIQHISSTCPARFKGEK